MFYLDFWYFVLVFFLGNKTVYEKWMTSRNVSRKIYFENTVVHSSIFLSRRKPLTGAMTNFVYNKVVKWFVFV